MDLCWSFVFLLVDVWSLLLFFDRFLKASLKCFMNPLQFYHSVSRLLSHATLMLPHFPVPTNTGIYIYIYSIRFAAPGGPAEWLKAAFLREGMPEKLLQQYSCCCVVIVCVTLWETCVARCWGSGDNFGGHLGSGGTLEHQKATQRHQEDLQEYKRWIWGPKKSESPARSGPIWGVVF